MIMPFLNYQGQCADAIALYEDVFGAADKRVMRFGDAPGAPVPEHMKSWVMHAEMKLCGTLVWMGDTPDPVTPGTLLTLGVTLPTPDAVKTAFSKLAQGGKAHAEPAPVFYSPLYAAVEDKFGVIWHLMAAQ